MLSALAGGAQTNGPGRAGQQLSQPPKRPRTDWGLGLSVAYDAELLEASPQSCVLRTASI